MLLKAIGDRHGVSLSSVATRWVLDQPQVAAAIVGARYARHLPKTLEVFDLSLTPEDHAQDRCAAEPLRPVCKVRCSVSNATATAATDGS